MADRPLYAVSRAHLVRMTGRFGIWQHAIGSDPDPSSGYCSDDVARALLVDLAHARQVPWSAVEVGAWRSLQFLDEAFDPTARRFRNFRDASGAWLEEVPSEDAQGRALLALGMATSQPTAPRFAAQAGRLFSAAVPLAGELRALRAISSSIIGCIAALAAPDLGAAATSTTTAALNRLTTRLRAAFAPAVTGNADWPWPEPVLTCENALLPRALMAAGRWRSDDDLVQVGLRTLNWLITVETASNGMYSPIGNEGWWPQGGTRSQFDQVPIEATSLILACTAAFDITADQRYRGGRRARLWLVPR